MVKQTVTYTDFNGNSQTVDLYFNLNKIELIDLDSNFQGGLQKALTEATEKEDNKAIIDIVKLILKKAYGQKSADGKRFLKSAEAAEEFAQSEEYSELFFSLLQDENKFTSFITGIMPADLVQQVNNNLVK